MNAIRKLQQVTAWQLPAEAAACCIRYRLPAIIDQHLPELFHDAVTMISPLPDSADSAPRIVEACSPGAYHASSFLGSTELEVQFLCKPGEMQASISGFDDRIRRLGMGCVRHREALTLRR